MNIPPLLKSQLAVDLRNISEKLAPGDAQADRCDAEKEHIDSQSTKRSSELVLTQTVASHSGISLLVTETSTQTTSLSLNRDNNVLTQLEGSILENVPPEMESKTTVTRTVAETSDGQIEEITETIVVEDQDGDDSDTVVITQTSTQTRSGIAGETSVEKLTETVVNLEEGAAEDANVTITQTTTQTTGEIDAMSGELITETIVSSVSVSAEDIEAAFHQSEHQYSVTGLSLKESTILLLKNGLAYSGLTSSPLELTLPQAEQAPDSNWSEWRLSEEGSYELLDKALGLWSAISGAHINTAPLQKPQLQGNYIRTDTQNWAGTVFVDTDSVNLSGEGGFTLSSSSMSNFGGIGSHLSASNTVTSASSNLVTTSTTVSANAGGAALSVSSRDANSTELRGLIGDRFGDYELLNDGMTIEFLFANGESQKELFFKMGDRINIGGKTYVKHGQGSGGTGDELAKALVKKLDQGTVSTLGVFGSIANAFRENSDEDNAHKTKPVSQPWLIG